MFSTTGFVDVPEGSLFWKYDTPNHPDLEQSFLLFLHAAVADHNLWDKQFSYLALRGYQCLSYDRLGYGDSTLSQSYLNRNNRPSIEHYKHPEKLITALEEQLQLRNRKCVVIGLSMGACTALDFALAYPSKIEAVMLCSGAVSGFEEPEQQQLDKELFESYAASIESASKGIDTEVNLTKAAKVQVRIWGDGLQAESNRLQNVGVRDKLFTWCKEIAAKEVKKIGGFAIPYSDLSDPSAADRIRDMLFTLKVRVAIGKYDETGTIEAMKYVHNEVNVKKNVKDAELMEFDAAHMCNMECSDEFNQWVLDFLGFLDDRPK